MKAHPPAYPFLFAFAPILGVFADNYFEVPPVDLLRPLIAAASVVLVGYAFSYMLVRNAQKAALLTLLAIIVLFAYGHVRDLVPEDIPRARLYFVVLLAAGIGVYVYVMVLLCETAARLSNVTQTLNWIGVATVAAPLAMAAFFFVTSPEVRNLANKASRPADGKTDTETENSGLPDIYYIVLDGHGREDILKSRYDLDYVPLVDSLRKKGFFVADKSVSNYAWTHLSLAATLNLTYLDEYIERIGMVPATKQGFQFAGKFFKLLIIDSEVRRFLESKGYQIIGNRSGYNVTRAFYSRLFPSPFSLNEFEKVLLDNTAL